ncbi:hypothetical protein CK231_21900 [Mesorhizobium loti]|uniref:DUF1348 family protein n=1 Tax=Rhizobium loti TaxID=381 RepID=UPI000BAEB7A3|nr:hypothetical protein CK231_21900 [Mesorhizobium loti]
MLPGVSLVPARHAQIRSVSHPKKWSRELDYRVHQGTPAYGANHIAVRCFAYEWVTILETDSPSYGNENWKFGSEGPMRPPPGVTARVAIRNWAKRRAQQHRRRLLTLLADRTLRWHPDVRRRASRCPHWRGRSAWRDG